MERTTITGCHSLTIHPLQTVKQYMVYGSRVSMLSRGMVYSSNEVPGTVVISHNTDENGIIRKQISFKRSDTGYRTQGLLTFLSMVRIVATYIDEAGKLKVCGSPIHPLTLKFEEREGLCEVTLEGSDTCPDRYLEI